MQAIVKWGTSWRYFWADIPGFTDVYQERGWLSLLSWPWGCHRMDVWEGRKGRVKWQDGKRIFCSVNTITEKRTSLELQTAWLLSCPLFSPANAESVQENELHFPIVNYFVAIWGQAYSAFLAQVMTSKGVTGAGTFLLNWKKSRREARAESGCSTSADASHFPALTPTDTKTNIKERNEWSVCASMLVQQPRVSVVQSFKVIYFVICWNKK